MADVPAMGSDADRPAVHPAWLHRKKLIRRSFTVARTMPWPLVVLLAMPDQVEVADRTPLPRYMSAAEPVAAVHG